MGGNAKRKMPDNPTPEMLKRMKMDVSSSPSTPPYNGDDISLTATQLKGKSRAVTVEDVSDDEGDMKMDKRNFAPGGDADYFAEEDEEGRFFGGGLTGEQKEILNIFENSGGEGVQEDVSSTSRMHGIAN
jgi:beta-catenin-like protein 1